MLNDSDVCCHQYPPLFLTSKSRWDDFFESCFFISSVDQPSPSLRFAHLLHNSEVLTVRSCLALCVFGWFCRSPLWFIEYWLYALTFRVFIVLITKFSVATLPLPPRTATLRWVTSVAIRLLVNVSSTQPLPELEKIYRGSKAWSLPTESS